VIWRFMQRGTLEQAADEIDTKAVIHDELKTAYWFINHPQTSDWVDVQIRRAAQRASVLNIDRLYPRVIPNTSYVAAGLFALVIGLNFVPLPWNNNWIALHAAPAFSLTEAEKDFLAQAQQLLEKTDQLNETDLAEQIQTIMQQLQDGEIDLPEALKRLGTIQEQLGNEDLDTEAIDEAMDRIAEDLETSEEFKQTAQALRDMDLSDAARKLQEMSEELKAANAERLKSMQESLQNASENEQSDLQELSSDLESSAESLKAQDTEAAKKTLQKAAEFLKDLSSKIQSQQLKDQANQQLQSLSQAFQRREQSSEQASNAGDQQQPGGESGDRPPAREVQPRQDANGQGTAGDDTGDGSQEAGDPSSRSGEDGPVEGPPTENLNVQLEKEQLTGQYDREVNTEEIEQTSKQERSKLDYRNVPSELSAAQKDVLNQDRIPWEYRPLIKSYFEAIRPPRENK
jgi:DNA repair exonuclease SbcCD ATPase subunit